MEHQAEEPLTEPNKRAQVLGPNPPPSDGQSAHQMTTEDKNSTRILKTEVKKTQSCQTLQLPGPKHKGRI